MLIRELSYGDYELLHGFSSRIGKRNTRILPVVVRIPYEPRPDYLLTDDAAVLYTSIYGFFHPASFITVYGTLIS